mmetsp:Transcript_36256/g.84820  ORF Transcript_36256/g.84820 Transcript_36256/m.84820 type:complete len:512 (-) Transcript_36256:723-2258(-)
MMRTRSQSRQKKQRAENRLLAENNVPQESAQPSTPSTSPVFARPDAERRDSRNTKNASEAAKIRDDDIESNTYPSGVLSTRKNQPTFLPDPTSGDTSSSENFACEQQRLNVTFGHDAGAHLYNIQSWLTESCPSEVLYRVISFAGPQTVQALSRTCRKWRDVILDEGDVEDEDENGSSVLWKILCEDYGKWEPSSNLQPVVSWREHYQLNPLVPIDYTTITRALNSLRQLFRSSSESTLRILLRPGSYVLSHSLNIGSNRTIIFQTVPNALPWREGIDKIPLMRKLPSDAGTESGASMGLQGGVSPRRLRRLPGSGLLSPPVWREMLAGCRGKGGAGGTVNSFSEEATSRRRVVVLPQGSHPDPLALSALRRNRAVLSLRTGRQNEPTFRVQRGHLELRDLDIVHSCAGNDIWNGNSAVQIQPPMGQNGEVILRPGSYMPSAIVHNCGIRSISGRGIVVIDGGVSRVSDCFIHHCAATGIYVGGSGSRYVNFHDGAYITLFLCAFATTLYL